MSATLIKGKPIAERIRAEVAEQVDAIGHIGLVTVLVGDDPASEVYIRLKHKAALEGGFDAHDVRLPAETSEEELLARVSALNADDAIDAILVQLPLPAHIDEARILRAIAPAKDVDGLHPFNAGQLFLGKPTLVGATPVGVMEMLREHKIEIDGARAVVIGRSDIVGKPMAHLLLQANATVTVCHSHTRDLARHTLDADILVAAVGVPTMVSPDMVRAGGRRDRRRNQPHRCRPRRRRRSRRRRGRGVHDARSGRGRPDDDRMPAPKRGSLRALSPRGACISRVIRC